MYHVFVFHTIWPSHTYWPLDIFWNGKCCVFCPFRMFFFAFSWKWWLKFSPGKVQKWFQKVLILSQRPNFCLVVLFWGRSRIPNPVLVRLKTSICCWCCLMSRHQRSETLDSHWLEILFFLIGEHAECNAHQVRQNGEFGDQKSA